MKALSKLSPIHHHYVLCWLEALKDWEVHTKQKLCIQKLKSKWKLEKSIYSEKWSNCNFPWEFLNSDALFSWSISKGPGIYLVFRVKLCKVFWCIFVHFWSFFCGPMWEDCSSDFSLAHKRGKLIKSQSVRVLLFHILVALVSVGVPRDVRLKGVFAHCYLNFVIEWEELWSFSSLQAKQQRERELNFLLLLSLSTFIIQQPSSTSRCLLGC